MLQQYKQIVQENMSLFFQFIKSVEKENNEKEKELRRAA